MPDCTFAPYFPPEEPQKFANVHKIFGASNVTKLLNELPQHQREDAVNSLAYEAEARVRDPVYGCVGAISFLQRQVERLQKELDAANADLIRYAHEINPAASAPHGGMNMMMNQPYSLTTTTPRQRRMAGGGNGGSLGGLVGGGGGGGGNFLHQTTSSIINFPYPPYPYPYPSLPWNDNNPSGDIPGGGGGGGNI